MQTIPYATTLLALRIVFVLLLVLFISMVLYLVRRDAGSAG